ncbi:hypothetical protein RJ55_02254 [Drechmeria coniospora]|nr:hypothetical protein RJ55_02254 [Drechmeria coniospora]
MLGWKKLRVRQGDRGDRIADTPPTLVPHPVTKAKISNGQENGRPRHSSRGHVPADSIPITCRRVAPALGHQEEASASAQVGRATDDDASQTVRRVGD